MSIPERQRLVAQHFLAVVPALLHRLGTGLRTSHQTQGRVTMAQFRTMATLHQGPRTLTALATLHEVAAPTMSRLVSTLVERGWVQREPDPADRRQIILSLTPAGEGIWQAMIQQAVAHLAHVLDELTEAELEQLSGALDGLARVLVLPRPPDPPC